MPDINLHPSSYRDPSGFVFEKNGVLYRQINTSFKEHFDHFMQSGCYDQLTGKGLAIRHEKVDKNLTGSPSWYKTIKPERVEFISYPYEWSFDMLKDAALLTLQLVKEGLSFNMILKDATPYNIQWHKGRLIFIDTLSFEKYEEKPWIAYRQFCENFLGPLLIMHYSKQQMPGLLLAWPDGIPLPVVRSLLPKRSRFSLHTYLHVHLHARISGRKKDASDKTAQLSRQKLINLISSLEVLIKRLKTPEQKSTWSEYYDEAGRRNDYLDQKKKIISAWLSDVNITTAADLGANEGEFSQLLTERNIHTIAADFDPYCINRLYNKIKAARLQNIQPLVSDLANPAPAIGVNNKERSAFIDRIQVDLVLALALIHHLAIARNIPLEMIAEFFGRLGKNLVVEFISKEDEKVKLMLQQKKDIYTGYSEPGFVQAFEKWFRITDKKVIPGTKRSLYFMTRNER
jgi:hypothetical protein